MITSAIRGFNREWTAITSIRNLQHRDIIIGYRLQTECGIERKFPNEHWDDPYGAAIQAMENHRCGHAG